MYLPQLLSYGLSSVTLLYSHPQSILFFNSHSSTPIKFYSFFFHPFAYKISFSFPTFVNHYSNWEPTFSAGLIRDSWFIAYRLFSIDAEMEISLFSSSNKLFVVWIYFVPSSLFIFIADGLSMLELESCMKGKLYFPKVKLKLFFWMEREFMLFLDSTFCLMKMESWLLWISVEIVLAMCFWNWGLISWLNWWYIPNLPFPFLSVSGKTSLLILEMQNYFISSFSFRLSSEYSRIAKGTSIKLFLKILSGIIIFILYP